jgi:tetratricopeptide (TPR) repeat protein
VVNHGWVRPAANLVSVRSTTIHRLHGWGGGLSSYYPYSSSYYPDYGSYPYSVYPTVYPYVSPYLRSGSLIDPVASSSSSQPAPSSPAPRIEEAAIPREEVPAEVRRRMVVARVAFEKGDYAWAQLQGERATYDLPGDANLYQFRALCQFAQGNHNDAAVTLSAALAAGPGWDWNTLSSFYESAQPYTEQLRALEQSVREHPKDAAGHFVLAYHYLVLDDRAAALDQLREVVKLKPNEKVSAGILEALERDSTFRPTSPREQPTLNWRTIP